MYNEKLVQIGNKLNVTKKDIRNIKRRQGKDKLLFPVSRSVIAMLSGVVGFIVGSSLVSAQAYPYAVGGFASVAQKQKKTNYLLYAIIAAVMAIVGFLVYYYKAQYQIHGVVPGYGVYSKKQKEGLL